MAANPPSQNILTPEELLLGTELLNYHLSPEEVCILSAEIASLEQEGVICKQVSDYKNQIFLNKDPDDPYKLVIDLSSINGYLNKFNFVPKPKKVWSVFRNKKYISTLKVNRAYYQIEVPVDQQPFTGFAFQGEEYVFKRLTPGLYGCEDMLQGLLLLMFKDILYEKVFAYLETIFVFGEKEDDHRRNVMEARKRLKGGSMTATIPDGSFYQPSVELLGHKISNNKLEMLDSKLQVIRRTECPKTLLELFEFIDAAQFYKDMVKGFATLAAPLTDLFDEPRRLTVDLHLNVNQEMCLQELKRQLLMKPVLSIFDQNAEIILHVSASKIAIAGDLYQVDPTTQERLPVGYFSQKVAGKKNWDLFDLEMLAIAESFQYFEEYLKKCAHQFEMCPASSPLVYVQRLQTPSERLKKLRLRICRFGFNFRHVWAEENLIPAFDLFFT